MTFEWWKNIKKKIWSVEGEVEDAFRLVVGLSIEEAEKKAFDALSQENRFRCEPTTKDTAIPPGLPKTVERLFNKYSHVSIANNDEMHIGIGLVEQSKTEPTYTMIGYDDGGHLEIIFVPEEEEVYCVDGGNKFDPDKSDSMYPSIFHFIVMIDHLFYG